jgi:hypothetical protein
MHGNAEVDLIRDERGATGRVCARGVELHDANAEQALHEEEGGLALLASVTQGGGAGEVVTRMLSSHGGLLPDETS